MITHNIAPETPAMTCFYCVMATGYFPDDFDVPLCAKHQHEEDCKNALTRTGNRFAHRADLVIARRTLAQHAWSDDLDLFNGIPTLWVGYGYFDRNPQEAFALKIDNHDTD